MTGNEALGSSILDRVQDRRGVGREVLAVENDVEQDVGIEEELQGRPRPYFFSRWRR